MALFGTIFIVIFAVAAVLIIAFVLLQDEQGDGFGGLFGGGSSAPLAVGGNFLARVTSFLGGIFLVSSLVVAISFKRGETDNVIGESRRTAGTGQDWFLEQPVDNAAEQSTDAPAVDSE